MTDLLLPPFLITPTDIEFDLEKCSERALSGVLETVTSGLSGISVSLVSDKRESGVVISLSRSPPSRI